MHIGLIGGIGPAATEFYYRHLVRRHEAEGRPMELTIVHAHVHTLAANAIAGRAEAQAGEYAALTARLKGAGAEAVAITSIGGHFCFDEFEPVSPLPVLNVAPAIAAGLRARGIRKIGLIGTAVAMTSGIYGALSDIGTVIPEGDDLQTTNDVYIALARAGAVSEDGRATLFRIGRDLVERQGRGSGPARRHRPVRRVRRPRSRLSDHRRRAPPRRRHRPRLDVWACGLSGLSSRQQFASGRIG